ncbi:MAG: sterol desaturase family protein [Bacteroidia bacterium]
MEPNYIALSVPIFFILIGLEVFWSWYKSLKLYRLSDAITNISCGIGQQITGILFKTIILFSYFWLFENARLFTIPSTWYWWLVLFVGVDFCYYWFHRMSHEVNAIWATHVVHHQSEDYNLSVALRQSWFQSFFSNLFYLPLAIIGFDPLVTVTVIAVNTLYQFWIHTELIKNMGWFEYIFNTPSHHRVHHGSNPEYIDKNHGGTLIIWDRMFGTFIKEDQPVIYGITVPFNSWNPLWANFHYWKEILQTANEASGFKDKFKVFFASPGWKPGIKEINIPNPSGRKKFELLLTNENKVYAIVQFAIVLAVSSILLFSEAKMKLTQLIPLILWSLFAIVSLGKYLEGNKFKMHFECIRIISLMPCVILTFSIDSIVIIILTVYTIGSVLWLFKVTKSSF